MTYQYSNGARFANVTVNNPTNMPYPVTPCEGYVAIMVASKDGKPLAKSAMAVVSAVSTSFNTGFKLNVTKSTQGNQNKGPKNAPPSDYLGAWAECGTSPVLVARVGVSITCRDLAGMSYTLRDWQMHNIGQGKVGPEGLIVIAEDKPIFCIELRR